MPTRSPDVPEGVVGRFVPTASPVEEPEAAAVLLLAAALDDGVLPVSPLLSTPLLPVLEDGDVAPVAAVCLGETSDVLDVLDVTRLAFLTGVVGLELRPCGVFLPDDPGDVPVGV